MIQLSRRQFSLGAAAMGTLIVSGIKPAAATPYPSQDVHFVCGFPPGSGADIITRFISEKMRPQLNRPVVVENKSGAVGNIAIEYTARAKPDGYTIYVTNGSSLAASAHLFKNPPVDIAKSIEAVGTFARHPLMVVVAAESKYKDIAQLTAAVKQKGDKAGYGVAFPVARVAGALYNKTAGTSAVEVQYRSSSDWFNDLASGQLDFAFIDPANGLAQVRAGRLRAVAVTSDERSPVMPDYPTMKESGYPMDIRSWWAVFVPAGTSKEIIAQINRFLVEGSKGDDSKRFIENIGMEPWASTPEEAQAYYLKEIADWGGYVRVANIEKQG